MKDKDKLSVGVEIKINELHHEVLNSIHEDELACRHALTAVSHNLKKADERLWSFIKEAYPATKGHELNFNHKTKTITIIGYERH